MFKRSLTPAVALILIGPVFAAQGHQHGQASAAISMDGNTLTIDFEADMADMVGFERAPRDVAEEAALAALEERLRDGPPLFSAIDRAGCTLESAKVEGAYLGDAVDHHAHDDHEHEAAGDHDHEHEHENHAHGVADHLIVTSWTWTCAAPERLTWVETDVFSAFPAIERIETVIFSSTGQAGAILSSSSTRAQLPK